MYRRDNSTSSVTPFIPQPRAFAGRSSLCKQTELYLQAENHYLILTNAFPDLISATLQLSS